MAGYYDRLEAQLADATERGAPRRRFAPRPSGPRLRTDLVAVSLALAACVVVVVVFLGLGARHRPAEHVGTHGLGLTVIRNYAPAKLPALSGQMVCDTTLQPPGGAKSPSATMVVNTRPPTRYVFSITASGLKPNVGGSVYAVWLRPAVLTSTGSYQVIKYDRPEFIGLIKPSVAGDGRVAAEGLLPQAAGGAYEVVITLQPDPSAKTPGRTVLQGDISF
jgi:hypothetical protein